MRRMLFSQNLFDISLPEYLTLDTEFVSPVQFVTILPRDLYVMLKGILLKKKIKK